jgi:hypothetical protein
MTYPISDKVLQEILRAFAWEDAALPSEDAVRELAAAAGQTDETIKARLYPCLPRGRRRRRSVGNSVRSCPGIAVARDFEGGSHASTTLNAAI